MWMQAAVESMDDEPFSNNTVESKAENIAIDGEYK